MSPALAERFPSDPIPEGRPKAVAPVLQKASKVWYGLGQAAEGIKNHSFASFLFFYYTAILGLSGTSVSIAIAVALLFDAVTDPLAGALSDRLDSRWGRRHPFMVASALPLGVFFYLVFAPPSGLSETQLVAWLAVFAVLTRAAMTLYHVPHMSLGAELSDDYAERTEIVKQRSLFNQIGAMVCGGAMLLWFMRGTPEFEDGRFNPAAYPAFAALFSVVMIGTIFASAWKTRDRIPYLARPDEVAGQRNVLVGMLQDMLEALRIPSFRALFIGTTLLFVAVGVAVNVGMHVNTYVWQISTEQIAVIGVGAVVGVISGLLFWPSVAVRIDKKPTFILGFVIFIAFAAGPLLLKPVGLFPPRESLVFMPLLAFTWFAYSFGVAATMVTGGSMMADVTDEDELLYGRRREGIFFGASAFSAKAAVGLGALVAGPIVDFAGFEKGMEMDSAPLAMSNKLAIADGLTIVVLMGLATLVFTSYALDRKRHAAIREALDRRASDATA